MSQVLDPVEVSPVVVPPVTILPATHPTSGMPKNYRVAIARFGAYKRGDVVPKHVVVRAAGAGAVGRETEVCDEKVLKRQLIETYDDVNVEIAAPVENVLPSMTPSATDDVKNMEVKVSGLRSDLETMTKDRDGWKATVASKDSMLSEQAGLIGELRAIIQAKDEVIAKQQGEIRVLTDTLDAATQPKGNK